MWPGDQQQFRPMGGWPAGAFAPGTYNAGPAAGRPPAYAQAPPKGKGLGGKGFGSKGGGFDEEDRSRDWHCPKCRERNFVKRTHCFRCQNPKPDDCQVGLQEKVKSGQTLNGMVKSYNRKGFGFLMPFGLGDFNDIYYTRENLSPKLETRDIPGQHVTFEILRMPDGKMIATNIRPQGEDLASARAAAEPGAVGGKGYSNKGSHSDFTPLRGKEEEDRSRDWECSSCGTRNFVKRTECFQCKTLRSKGFSDAPAGSTAAPPPPPRREISPHAGSRAMAFSQRRQSGSRSSRSRSPVRKKKKKKKDKKKKKSSSSDSSDESKKDKKKKKKRKKDSSSDSSAKSVRSDSSDDVKVQASGGAAAESVENPEIQKAKNQALEEMLALKAIEPVEARMKEWRALLRKWHPDKNPDKTEVATAVFQFLQKGKPLLENK